MPNLQQIFELKETYSQLRKADRQTQDYLTKRNLESIALAKAFSFSEKALFENFDIPPDKPSIIEYFENVVEEEVVLLFIDIANFSETITKRSNKFITNYLTNYYKAAFPLIYKYGGQIEKLMGDGIICVFGKPFIDVSWPTEFNRAEKCARDIINYLKGSNKEVKVALHSGPIRYYKTPVEHYEEYTMIGSPITDLFRLESVAVKNSINFFGETIYDKMNPKTKLGISVFDDNDVKLGQFQVTLKGTDYSVVKYLVI